VCNIYHAELLARSQYSKGPATGHLDTGFSLFLCVYKQMLRWLLCFQVATTCFSRSPPGLKLDLSVTSSIYIYIYIYICFVTCDNHCYRVTAQLQLIIIIIIIMLMIMIIIMLIIIIIIIIIINQSINQYEQNWNFQLHLLSRSTAIFFTKKPPFPSTSRLTHLP
jgi:hypothetical protein